MRRARLLEWAWVYPLQLWNICICVQVAMGGIHPARIGTQQERRRRLRARNPDLFIPVGRHVRVETEDLPLLK